LKPISKWGLFWGVTPLLVPYADTLETMIKHVETAIATATDLKKGQKVILISGFPVGAFRQPNLALLYTLGDACRNKKTGYH
jgi:pyruvate kinase